MAIRVRASVSGANYLSFYRALEYISRRIIHNPLNRRTYFNRNSIFFIFRLFIFRCSFRLCSVSRVAYQWTAKIFLDRGHFQSTILFPSIVVHSAVDATVRVGRTVDSYKFSSRKLTLTIQFYKWTIFFSWSSALIETCLIENLEDSLYPHCFRSKK